MKNTFKRIYLFLNLFGFDPLKLYYFFKGLPFFIRDFYRLKKQCRKSKDFKFRRLYPVFEDKFNKSGTMKGHYFHQDLLIARRIFEKKPLKHIDIGSRTDGFVAHLAVFREVEIFDIRQQENKVKNIIFKQADLMNMPESLVEYCDSVSSLHVIEHFGLGRYGDPIDIDGHLKALNNIYKILKPDGTFYFSVPIGAQRIEFNAHRVFSIKYILNIIEGKFIVNRFSYVDDNGDLYENVDLKNSAIESNFGCIYGCGIFELVKVNLT